MNRNILEGRIKEKGYNIEKIANKIGVNTATFYRKLSGESDFFRLEILKISEILELSFEDVNSIFFEIKLQKG